MLTESQLAQDAQEEAESPRAQTLGSQQKDAEIALSIKSLQEESLQISELVEMEKTYSVEVISQLKQLIEPLNVAFHVKPSSVSKSDSTIGDVVLTPQGIVCIIHTGGTINSRSLESLPSEILMRILIEVVPQVKQLLSEKRQKISGRVGTLEKIAREFRKVAVGAPHPKPTRGPAATLGSFASSRERSGTGQDAIKGALTENQDQ